MRRLALAAVVLLAGCSSSTVPLAGSHAGVPAGERTWTGPTSGEHMLLSDGRLYSEQLDSSKQACFWFVSSTGSIVSLTWPAGWSAQAKPLRVLDASGREVARTFQEGLGFTGHYEAGRTGCAPGGLSRSFTVTKVEQVGVGSADKAH